MADVRPVDGRATPYTRWGDWFPAALAILLMLLTVAGVAGRRAASRARPGAGA